MNGCSIKGCSEKVVLQINATSSLPLPMCIKHVREWFAQQKKDKT